jgi:biopolymer transport protein ExbD
MEASSYNRPDLLDSRQHDAQGDAMDAARRPRRHVRLRIEEPPPLDGLMRYVMLGSTFGSLLACLFFVRFILESPKVEVYLPLKRVTQEELAGALASAKGNTVTVAADGTVLLGGKVMGEPEDLSLVSLSLAAVHRRVKDENAPPLVIHVSPQAKHERMMTVMNALAAVREKRFIVTFADPPDITTTWRGR